MLRRWDSIPRPPTSNSEVDQPGYNQFLIWSRRNCSYTSVCDFFHIPPSWRADLTGGSHSRTWQAGPTVGPDRRVPQSYPTKLTGRSHGRTWQAGPTVGPVRPVPQSDLTGRSHSRTWQAGPTTDRAGRTRSWRVGPTNQLTGGSHKSGQETLKYIGNGQNK
jgi:hypothetical protein